MPSDFDNLLKRHPTPWRVIRDELGSSVIVDAKGEMVPCEPETDEVICASVNVASRLLRTRDGMLIGHDDQVFDDHGKSWTTKTVLYDPMSRGGDTDEVGYAWKSPEFCWSFKLAIDLPAAARLLRKCMEEEKPVSEDTQ